jgi:hypothetical protein
VDLENLRLVLKPLVVGLKHRSHAEIPSICQQLGLKEPPGPDLSKSQRMQAAFDETPDHELPAIGARYIEYFVSSAAERNKLQELLWNDDTGPTIPRKQRHDIARSLDVHDLYIDAGQFDQLLDRLFVLDDALGAIHVLFGDPDRSLRAEIAGHVHRNPGDWSPYELFDRLGARVPAAVVAKKWAVAWGLDETERTSDHVLGIASADFFPTSS